MLTNNYEHQNLSNQGSVQLGLEEESLCQETGGTDTHETVIETVPPEKWMRLLSETALPDRSIELEKIKMEIRKIELEISDRVNLDASTVPPAINITLQVGTVPPKYEVVKSTRKRRIVRVGKGVEPKGENGKIWRLKHDM